MTHDRDFSWMGRPAPPAAVAVEHVLFVMTKDTRTASVLVRQHPLGQDLICLMGRDLLWSQVFRPGDGRDLGRVAADTLRGFTLKRNECSRWTGIRSFEARGWLRVADPDA